MVITVDSNITMCGRFVTPARVELPGESATVRDLFSKIGELCRSMELMRGDKLGEDVHTVIINGKETYLLDAKINDGDQVMVMAEITPFGGG
ncbi:MAG: MoaD/ThiS family protein [Chloroflexi bacterium]|nr:MoaD/ThiS family protein [Chloroflexota bacterium]